MILHRNNKLMTQLIRVTAEKYNINPKFVEKDYWITLILQNLSRNTYKLNCKPLSICFFENREFYY